jgi:hypothetical protein
MLAGRRQLRPAVLARGLKYGANLSGFRVKVSPLDSTSRSTQSIRIEWILAVARGGASGLSAFKNF